MHLVNGKNKKYQRQVERVNESRSQLREKDARIIQMFPKYIEKSGSKKHAQFLFGNTQTDKLFKDYSRLRFEHDVSRGSIRPRDNSKNRSIEPVDQNN